MPDEEHSATGPRREHPFDDETLVEHAVRMWDAEVENARRHAARTNIYASLMIALFGLGLFKIDWMHRQDEIARVHWLAVEFLVRGLLIVGLIFIAIAYMKLLISRPTDAEDDDGNLRGFLRFRWKKTPETIKEASAELDLPDWYIEHPPLSIRKARKAAFGRTYAAALELRSRNIREKERIIQATKPLMIGLAAILVALVIYLATSWAPDGTMIDNGRSTSHEHHEAE